MGFVSQCCDDDFICMAAGLVYKQYIHSNKHTKSQNRNYKEKKKIKIIKNKKIKK